MHAWREVRPPFSSPAGAKPVVVALLAVAAAFGTLATRILLTTTPLDAATWVGAALAIGVPVAVTALSLSIRRVGPGLLVCVGASICLAMLSSGAVMTLAGLTTQDVLAGAFVSLLGGVWVAVALVLALVPIVLAVAIPRSRKALDALDWALAIASPWLACLAATFAIGERGRTALLVDGGVLVLAGIGAAIVVLREAVRLRWLRRLYAGRDPDLRVVPRERAPANERRLTALRTFGALLDGAVVQRHAANPEAPFRAVDLTVPVAYAPRRFVDAALVRVVRLGWCLLWVGAIAAQLAQWLA